MTENLGTTDGNAQQVNVHAYNVLNVYYGCEAPACSFWTINCVKENVRCLTCLQNPARYSDCDDVLLPVTSACIPCSPSFRIINRIVIATQVTGALGIFACLCALFVIWAGYRDTRNIRDRILVGLFCGNIVYSAANCYPMFYTEVDGIYCGIQPHLTHSLFWRSIWLGGKYAILGFESFILLASHYAFRVGIEKISRPAEGIAHILSSLLGFIAFIVFYDLSLKISEDGYSTTSYEEAVRGSFSYLHADDDAGDDIPDISAGNRFTDAKGRYDALFQKFLIVWCVVLLVTAILWILLRVNVSYVLAGFRRSILAARVQWSEVENTQDGYAPPNLPHPAILEKNFAHVQQLATDHLVQPLEPYVAVFIIFGIPAAVMASSYCSNHSGVSTHSNGYRRLEQSEYCDAACELVLAFRALFTAVVFFRLSENRSEILDWRQILRGLQSRLRRAQRHLKALIVPTVHRASSVVSRHSTVTLQDISKKSLQHRAMAWRIEWHEVTVKSFLAEGAFGRVYSGEWQQLDVAIKVMKGADHPDAAEDPAYRSAVDRLNAEAMADFERECKTLQQLRHPHVLAFHGAGMDPSGQLFMVTELLVMGSLYDTLCNQNHPMPWTMREHVAYQIALGMEFLHARAIVHRDLKSPNVFLDDVLSVKVGDVGTATVVSAAMRAAGADPDALQSGTKSMASNTFDDVAGTLLWMAPELLSGVASLPKGASLLKTDVFSYGILLWEIATRQTTSLWKELQESTGIGFPTALAKALNAGERPTLRSDFQTRHPLLAKVMSDCWQTSPARRPTFSRIVELFGEGRAPLFHQTSIVKQSTEPKPSLSSDRDAPLFHRHSIPNDLAEPLLKD